MTSFPRFLLVSSFAIAQQHVMSSSFSLPLEGGQTAVPEYVMSYAPLIWIHPEDKYFPSDIGAQLNHTKPEIDFSEVEDYPSPLTLDNLDSLNVKNGKDIYLTSIDDVTASPAWLNGVKPNEAHKTEGAISAAIIVNDRGNGHVDAFYMYFTAYNYGGKLLGQKVGEHVGDWEHNMIRFVDGHPTEVWYSQHEFGQAFTYDCLEKQDTRPIAYSSNGSHAVYATSGPHDHTIPNIVLPGKGILTDFTDQGTLWDPLLSAYFYRFNASANEEEGFTAYDPSYPTAWLRFVGRWGDEEYPDEDPRQEKILGIDAAARFVGGPTGPRDKQLKRKEVCPEMEGYFCKVRSKLGP